MMTSTAMALCILGMTSFHTAQAASCVETLSRDSTFISCIMGYSTFVKDNDPSHMRQAICSDHGRAKLACILGYMKQCPELKAENGGIRKGNLTLLISPEGIEAMCALMPGGRGGVGGACAEVVACAYRTRSQFDMNAEPGPSPFSNFQDNIRMICGTYVKDLNMCLEKAQPQCEDFVNKVKQMIPMYEEMNKYVMEKCPKVPIGFESNRCVRENVESEAFLECYRPVEQAYNQDPNTKKSCPMFLRGKKCVDDNVGVKCGQASADAITAAAPLLIMGIPTTCVVTPTSAHGSPDSGGLELSVTKLLMMMTLLFALFRHV